MTFLEICQQLRIECSVPGTGPSSVVDQTGELERLVSWAANAWGEIQSKHVAPTWRWMRSTFSVNTVAADDSYAFGDCTDTRLAATISRFRRWLPLDDNGYSNFKIYLSSAGVGTERWLPYLPWSDFRTIYRIGTQNAGPPAHFTVDPQNNLVLGPKPDAVYVVSGEYRMGNQVLAADGDEPEMPEDFHMLIVYRAMEKYGQHEVAVEVFNRGQFEGNKLMAQLELDQLPAMGLAEPLA